MIFIIYKPKLFALCVQAEAMLSFKIPGRSVTSLLHSFLLTCTACTLVEQILQDIEQSPMRNDALNDALKYKLTA